MKTFFQVLYGWLLIFSPIIGAGIWATISESRENKKRSRYRHPVYHKRDI
jgi:hypothetical protein